MFFVVVVWIPNFFDLFFVDFYLYSRENQWFISKQEGGEAATATLVSMDREDKEMPSCIKKWEGRGVLAPKAEVRDCVVCFSYGLCSSFLLSNHKYPTQPSLSVIFSAILIPRPLELDLSKEIVII